MTYLEESHRAHVERLRRLNAGPPSKLRVIAIKEVCDSQKVPVYKPVHKPKPTTVMHISIDESAAFGFEPIEDITDVKLRTILCETAIAHKLSVSEVKSKRRWPALVITRFEYYYRAVTETDASLPRIGAILEREHTTVLHGVGSYCIKNNLPLPRGADWARFKKAKSAKGGH